MRPLAVRLVLVAALSTVALAAPAAAQPSAIADEVKLRSGAIYRGVIRQLEPEGQVEIVLAGGEVRRFSMRDVEYAGATEQGAHPAAPDSEARAVAVRQGLEQLARAQPRSQVRFRANDERVMLHQVTGESYGTVYGYGVSGWSESHSFRPVCAAPCEPELPTGMQQLALSRGDGKPMIAPRIDLVPGPQVLEGHYRSRLGLRIAGYGLVGASIVGGSALMFGSMAPMFTVVGKSKYGTDRHGDLDVSMLGIGAGVMCVGAIVGVIMATRKDLARFEVSPVQVGIGVTSGGASAQVKVAF